MWNPRSAFTLVELAIVLVIIGILVGGVLVGKDLIYTAQVRSQIRQLEEYDAAALTFRSKYGALPGDIKNPTTFGFSNGSGNGNGILEDELIAFAMPGYPTARILNEPLYFFYHLSEAKLIKTSVGNDPGCGGCFSPGKQFPALKLGQGGILEASIAGGRRVHYLGINASTITNQYFVNVVSTGGVMTPFDAYSLDKKLDDGLPMSGIIRPMTSLSTYDTTTNSCITTVAANGYYVTNDAVTCRLIVIAP